MEDAFSYLDMEWRNGLAMLSAKRPSDTIEDIRAALITEYHEDGLPTPYDEGWRGTRLFHVKHSVK